ncbi:MAG: DNA-processing protein DprA [Hormoscilla sp.]
MSDRVLSPDTEAILLLCARFGQPRQTKPQPLTLGEYNTVAGWLRENQMSPKDLLDPPPIKKNPLPQNSIGKVDTARLVALLDRGMMLSLAVEKWTSQGLWVLGRGDARYPQGLKKRLKQSAPAIFYGAGNMELLNKGGLAVVGSRDVSPEELDYTRQVARTCAAQGMQVVSGGARGVDEASMLGILEAGGTAVGVLADSLTKAAVSGKYRQSIKEGRLTLISAYDPNASFYVGNAIGRNKYIYALGDRALVVSAEVGKGGSWKGAVEALEKIKDLPVFVRMELTVPQGNRELLLKGAKPFPELPVNEDLRELLAKETAVEAVEANQPFCEEDRDVFPTEIQDKKPNIYAIVLPLILDRLERPLDVKSLAEYLDVRVVQMQDWLNRAVAEGKVIKTNNPVRYVVNIPATQLDIWEYL